MKKTLSLLLVFAMLLSVCSSLMVFADDRVNVAAGKTYVISEQFRQSNITWGYDESFPPAYPDDGGELTDGKVPADDEGYLASGWVGFNHKTPAQTERGYAYITIDLEDMYALSGISVAYGKDTSVGITVPYWVEYFVSEDGDTFEKVGYSEINPDNAKSGTNWYSYDFDAAAQYVQLRVFSYGWAFVGEIEVYGMAYGAGSGPEVTASAEVVDGSVAIPSDEALAKLVDGEYAMDATAFSNAGLVAFQNTGFEHGKEDAVPATVAITVDLDYERTITKVSLTAYKELNSMIALPEVSFEVSVDGVNFYQINAGGIVKAADDTAENTVVTLTADFSTRAAVEARYVRAIASFTNGWIFLSELDVTETDAYTAVAPNAAFPYADTVSATAMGVYDAEDGTLDLAAKFKNSQLIKAVYDEDAGAYEIIYSKVNPWPAGQSGYETLGDHEILVAINTGGNLVAEADETKVVSNLFSACKWIARGLTEGDYLVFDAEAGTASFYPAEGEFEAGDCITTVKEPVAPQDPVAGEGNLVAGLEWTGDTNAGTAYVGDITDGQISEDTSYNKTLWYGFDQRLLGDGVASMIFDMVELYNNIENVKIYIWPMGNSGIAVPASYTVYGSANGVDYTELGAVTGIEKGDPQWIEITFEELVTARFIKIDIAGDQSTGVFWFVGEVEVNAKAADTPVDPEPEEPVAEEHTINVSHVNAYSWGAFNAFVITEIGKNCTNNSVFSYACEWWYAIKVDNGVVTAIEAPGTAKTMVVEEGGFILYVYSNDVDGWNAAGLVEVGDALLVNTVDLTKGAASETPVGYMTFGPKQDIDEPVDPEPEPDPDPEEPKVWEDTYTVLENGNAEVKIPYGYTWIIDDIDGKIGGEDTTLITNQDAYLAANPNWAITLYLEKQEDGSYLAVKNAIITPGSAANAGITLGENQVAFVVHSSSSKPTDAETYPNWLSKVVAMSVKAGDRFVIDTEAMTVYAVIPGEDYEVPGTDTPVDPEPEIPAIGDLDGDEAITDADVEVMMGYLVGSEEAPEDLVLDLDGNGAFDIYDCVLALQYVASLAE